MTEPVGPEPMPFDLWWSSSMKRLLSRHENQDDEHLVWIIRGERESLRHYLGTGLDSNPPMPDDAVRLVLADPAQTTELEKRLDETQQKLAEADRLYADLLAQREQWWEHVGRERAQLEAERDERQTRLDKALEWWRQERDADSHWPLSLEDSAKVNSLRYRVYAALTGHPLAEQPLPAESADQPVRAALVGDQPPAEATLECPHCRGVIRAASGAITQLEVDTHLADCDPARQFASDCASAALSGEDLRDVEERDDAAGDLP